MPYFLKSDSTGFTSDEPFYQKNQAMAELNRQRKADPDGQWTVIYKDKLTVERPSRRRR